MNNDPSKVHILYAGIVDEDGHLQELSDKIVEYFVDQGETLFCLQKLFLTYSIFFLLKMELKKGKYISKN